MEPKNWTEANLHKSIEKFAGKNPIITMTDKGKEYMKILQLKFKLLKILMGNISVYMIQVTQSEYNQVTHFKIKE